MLRALALLFTCQLAGEVVVRGLKAPVPGPVLGLVLLALGLALARRFGGPSSDTVEATALGRMAAGLLGVLGVLFVPAGVGLVQHLPLLRARLAATLELRCPGAQLLAPAGDACSGALALARDCLACSAADGAAD